MAMHGCDWQRRFLQGQTLNGCFDFKRHCPANVGIRPLFTSQPGEAETLKARHPALSCAVWYACLPDNRAQRPVLLKMRLEQMEPIQPELPDRFR